MQWIQRLIVSNQANGVISSAPPIVSRCFQELANGRLGFNAAKKIAAFPFPFPYAQMLMVMLIIHWIIAPIMAGLLLNDPMTCAAATFVTSLSFWCINYIAAELEMPFGDNPNDLPVEELQVSFNTSLRKLMTPAVQALPHFDFQKEVHTECTEIKMRSVEELFLKTGSNAAGSQSIGQRHESQTSGMRRKSSHAAVKHKDARPIEKEPGGQQRLPSTATSSGSGAPFGVGLAPVQSGAGASEKPEAKSGADTTPLVDEKFSMVPVSPEELQQIRLDQELSFLRNGVEDRLSKIVQELVHLLVPSSGARPFALSQDTNLAVGDPMHASLSPEFFFNEECFGGE
jgi:hypothetical protein